eukprot:jgi/Bigna1/80377/fgenesh1_pg.70_\
MENKENLIDVRDKQRKLLEMQRHQFSILEKTHNAVVKVLKILKTDEDRYFERPTQDKHMSCSNSSLPSTSKPRDDLTEGKHSLFEDAPVRKLSPQEVLNEEDLNLEISHKNNSPMELQKILIKISDLQFQQLNTESIRAFFPVIVANLFKPNSPECNSGLVLLDEATNKFGMDFLKDDLVFVLQVVNALKLCVIPNFQDIEALNRDQLVSMVERFEAYLIALE